MALVTPYHTNSHVYPSKHREVHHDRDECKVGKQIKLQHRAQGTGGKPRCQECIRLG